jgi:hypothetical protein
VGFGVVWCGLVGFGVVWCGVPTSSWVLPAASSIFFVVFFMGIERIALFPLRSDARKRAMASSVSSRAI